MFRIIKFLMGMVSLAVFVWFGANVPLGSRTLFEHLQAIGRTRETQDLLEGTRQSAKPLVDGVRKRLGGATATNETTGSVKAAADAGARPDDEISETDRQRLRKMLGTGHASR
jgi:hypothetical protein